MKRYSILVCLIIILLFSGQAFAHPASDILFNFNTQNNILSLGVVHAVEGPQKHFIKNLTIKLNGKVLIEQNFLAQTNLNVQAVSYVILGLKKGDIIEAIANCSKKGKLKKDFKIE